MLIRNSTASPLFFQNESVQTNISTALRPSALIETSTTPEVITYLNETQDLLAVLPTPSTSTMAMAASSMENLWTSMIPPAAASPNQGNQRSMTDVLTRLILPASNSTETPDTIPTTNLTDSESVVFVLVPLLLIVAIAFFSGIALYCISRRKKLDRLRHHLIPKYTFSPGEEEEWGELLNQAEPRCKY